MIEQKLTAIIANFKAWAKEKQENTKAYLDGLGVNRKGLYLYLLIFAPLGWVSNSMLYWVSRERQLGTLTVELLVACRLLQGILILMIQYPFTAKQNPGKIETYCSILLWLMIVYYFGHALLLYFGVVGV